MGFIPAIQATLDLSPKGVQTFTEASNAANVVPMRTVRDEFPGV